MTMAPTISQLRAMSDEQLAQTYDSIARHTGVGTQFYLDELVRRPGGEPRPTAPALDGWRPSRRDRLAGAAPVDHHPDPRIASMARAQVLVESRLVPCDDDQIVHRDLPCWLTGARGGSGEIWDCLPEQRAKENHRHSRVAAPSPAPRSGVGGTLPLKI